MKKVSILGLIIIIYGVSLFFVTGFQIGNLVVLLLGIFLFNYKYINELKWLKKLFLFGLLIFFGIGIFLFAFGQMDNITYEEDVLIVLGAGLKKDGKSPSLTLEKRLNSAIEYLGKNENAIVVVSGGLGTDKKISEGLAMKNYLISKGISETKILIEDKSTSTYENFQFSKEILNNYFGDDYKYEVAFVTNDFHVFRSNFTAKKLNFDSTHIGSDTPIYLLLPIYIREEMAMVRYLFY